MCDCRIYRCLADSAFPGIQRTNIIDRMKCAQVFFVSTFFLAYLIRISRITRCGEWLIEGTVLTFVDPSVKSRTYSGSVVGWLGLLFQINHCSVLDMWQSSTQSSRNSFSYTLLETDMDEAIDHSGSATSSMLSVCPACQSKVSARATTCPSCGHQLLTLSRTPFGKIVKWGFIAFNILMFLMLIAFWGSAGDVIDKAGSDAERAGAAIGGMLGTGFTLFIWVFGLILGGIIMLLTRPSVPTPMKNAKTHTGAEHFVNVSDHQQQKPSLVL